MFPLYEDLHSSDGLLLYFYPEIRALHSCCVLPTAVLLVDTEPSLPQHHSPALPLTECT